MHYAYPQLIWLSGPVVAVAFLAAGLLLLRRRLALRRLAALPSVSWLLARRSRPLLKTALVLSAIVLLAIALLGPQWGRALVPTQPAPSRAVLLVLDVSRSMLAEDVAPSRLGRAGPTCCDLLAVLEKKGGYRVGLIAFADRAALLCPLTSDYRCLQEEIARVSVDSVRLHGHSASDDGTLIGTALRRAAAAIDQESAPSTAVLLISDGGDMESDTLAAAEPLARLGVPVHAIGLGDPTHEALIPLSDSNGRRYLEYHGQPVRTRLQEDVLREVARRTGGQYIAAGTGFLDVERLPDTLLAARAAREVQTASPPTYLHRFQWFVAPAVVLLLLELLIKAPRRSVPVAPPSAGAFPWVRPRKEALWPSH